MELVIYTTSVVQAIKKLASEDKLTSQQRLFFKEQGAPKPSLQLKQTSSCKNKAVHRYFRPEMYKLADWLCGCDETNGFFCFPCLLFSSNDAAWCKNGVTDLKHLRDKIKKHNLTKTHMQSSMSFATLGRADVKLQLDPVYRKSIRDFNENVTKNRYILNKIIDCIKFCGAFELALRGDREMESSENPGVFRGLINFVSELDSVLKEQLNKSSAFQGVSKSIQSDLLESILAIVHEKIKCEIQQSDFLVIQVDEIDETAASCNKNQNVVIFRYVLNGDVYERFWKFINRGGDKIDDLANAIFGELEILEVNKTPEKLIAQSFNGASVRSGKFGSVKRRIKQHYPSANFIHCYAHQLNFILQKSVSQNKSVKIFLAILHNFSCFFGNSPTRTAVLDAVVKARAPSSVPTKWCFNARCTETVFAYQKDILSCLEKIIDMENDANTLSQAIGLINCLENKDFQYWLQFFHMIMPHCDKLFNQLQKRNIDIETIKNCIIDFKNAVEKIRLDILNNISLPSSSSTTVIPNKRPRNEDNKREISLEVCDIILSEIQHRFGFSDHLVITQLYHAEEFVHYKHKFPEDILKLVRVTYPFINCSKLKSELKVIYESEDFNANAGTGVLAILQLFVNYNLCETFSESVKLLKILCTLPMTTSESERCFSTFNRIKTFLRNTMGEDRLGALAMLSMEKPLIKSIPNFNEQVIDHFAKSKDRGIDLIFKST